MFTILNKLHNGQLIGAAINGLFTTATFGLSAFVGDVKNGATNLVRGRYLAEADAFGMQAAVRAGADPVKVLAGVRRMSTDAILPWSELKFGDGRVPALERLVAAMPASVPPAVAVAAVAPLMLPAGTPPVTAAVQPEKTVLALDATGLPVDHAKTAMAPVPAMPADAKSEVPAAQGPPSIVSVPTQPVAAPALP